jgi:hypothetical protein
VQSALRRPVQRGRERPPVYQMNSPPDPRIRDRAIPERPPRPRNDAKLEFTRKKRVAWFSPGLLYRAGQRVLVSSAFGDFLDKRELQEATPVGVISHRVDRDEAWIDYVADTGDGFDATYSTAWLTAQRVLEVDGVDRALPRGSLLVLGGDEVYPSGDSGEYDNRFKGPYKASLPYVSADQPALLAIPGNHDWYDGLTNFLRVFCQEKWIGGRRTLQSRSYFAVRLPQSWWLWGSTSSSTRTSTSRSSGFSRASCNRWGRGPGSSCAQPSQAGSTYGGTRRRFGTWDISNPGSSAPPGSAS